MRTQRMLKVHVSDLSPQAISGNRPRSFFSSSPFAQSMVLFDGLSRNSFAYSSLPPDVEDFPVNVTPSRRLRFNGNSRSFSSPFSLSLLLLDRSNFAYSGLPEEPLKLSVRRLDGSYFDIEVERSATVANLRQAIRDVFGDLPNSNAGNISWKHVWGHFCLCYNEQKLVNETDSIVNFGIKDGDQLHFARHLTIADTLQKSPSKKKATNRLMMPRAGSQNRARSGVEYDPISTEDDDDVGDLEEGRWMFQT